MSACTFTLTLALTWRDFHLHNSNLIVLTFLLQIEKQF